MLKRSRMITLALLIILTGTVLACGGGGGGGGSSPTQPPPPPVMSVAGSWSGLWFENRGLLIPVGFNLNQTGTQVTGEILMLIDIFLYVFEIEGTVTADRFSWNHIPIPGDCGTLDSPGMTGNTVNSPTEMVGKMRLDGRPCPDGLFYGGDIIVERDSGGQGQSNFNHAQAKQTDTRDARKQIEKERE